MRSKFFIHILLIFSFIFYLTASNGVPAKAAAYPNDIKGNWAYDQIIFLVDQGVITGYADGTFKPDNPVSRAEFIAMVNRAFGFTEEATIDYTDVSQEDWFYRDIARAKASGYISGLPDGSMQPDQVITRQEAAVILAKVMRLERPSDTTLPFYDADSIPGWSKEAIATMVKSGLISGDVDGSFKPFNPIQRDETASLLYRCIKAMVPVNGVSLGKSSVTLFEGYAMTLVATVAPDNAFNQAVTWTSSDESVAMVDRNGRVTAIKAGTATITVSTVDGNLKAACVVRVLAGPKAGLNMLDKLDLYLDGNTSKVVYAYLDGTDSAIKDADLYVEGQAVVDARFDEHRNYLEITFTGTAEGECRITISVEAEDGHVYQADCEVSVHQKAQAAKLSMPKQVNIFLDYNNGKIIRAYLDGSDSDIQGLEWDLEGGDVIDLDYSIGKSYIDLFIKGDKTGEGVLTLKASTENGGEYRVRCNITVIKLVGGQEGQAPEPNDIVEMRINDKATVRIYLPGTLSTADLTNIEWISGKGEIAGVAQYDKSSDAYINFTITSFDKLGKTSITFYLYTDEESYKANVYVTVHS